MIHNVEIKARQMVRCRAKILTTEAVTVTGKGKMTQAPDRKAEGRH